MSVIDLADMRLRRATGQPLFDRPSGQPLFDCAQGPSTPFIVAISPGDIGPANIGPGCWVKTAAGIIAYVQQVYRDEAGIARAIVTNGSGIRESHPIADLTLSRPLPTHLPILEGC